LQAIGEGRLVVGGAIAFVITQIFARDGIPCRVAA
jgi:hypothetical protein